MNDTVGASKESVESSSFNSLDFRKFLAQNGPLFHSKDSVISHLEASAFKSTEFLSNAFASSDWSSAAFNKLPPLSTEDGPPKSISACSRDAMEMEKSAAPSISAARINSDDEPDLVQVPMNVLKSRDWMPYNTLGNHVEVPYSSGIFSTNPSGSNSPPELPPTCAPRVKTSWDELFMAQLLPHVSSLGTTVNMPPTQARRAESPHADSKRPQMSASAPISGPPTAVALESQTASIEPVHSQGILSPNAARASGVTTSQFEAAKKKRKRAPRKKVVPATKVYVEPGSLDVLCGRGGRSNNNEGNRRYREEVDNLKEWYRNITDKDEKTDLSQCLIDYIKSYGARFLERDEKGWYVIDDIVARRKASQALREDTDPVKRQAKRQRFLAKRARLQEEARRKKAC